MKKSLIKFLFVIIVIISSFVLTIMWLDELNIKIDPSTLDMLIQNSNSASGENKVINTIVYTITNGDIKTPVDLILAKYDKNYDFPLNNNEIIISKQDEINDKNESDNPTFYIYNTHQVEKYNSTLPGGNINYSVIDAANLLKEKLLSYGIISIVEKSSIMDVLNANGFNYAQSYKVSRMYLENAKKMYPSLNYFIDLHRDSVSKSISTKVINGKSYAKTLFVLGLENKNYLQNQKNMEKLNKYLNENYPGLSRGILERKGSGVNGLYNQDFSENCILIEVGGEENTEEEVANTIEVIAKMLNLFSKGEL